MNDTRINGTHVAMAFIAGAAVGAVVAMLTTPRSGREMRESISDAAHGAADRAVVFPRAVHQAYSRAASAAREAFNRTLRETAEKVEEKAS